MPEGISNKTSVQIYKFKIAVGADDFRVPENITPNK
jgi:hypothetical protein